MSDTLQPPKGQGLTEGMNSPVEFHVQGVVFLDPPEAFDHFARQPIPEDVLPLLPLNPFESDANIVADLKEYIGFGNFNLAVIPLHLVSRFIDPNTGLADPVRCREWVKVQVMQLKNNGHLEGKAQFPKKIEVNGNEVIEYNIKGEPVLESQFDLKMTHFPTDEQIEMGFQPFIFGDYDENYPDARRIQLYLEMNDQILISPAF